MGNDTLEEESVSLMACKFGNATLDDGIHSLFPDARSLDVPSGVGEWIVASIPTAAAALLCVVHALVQPPVIDWLRPHAMRTKRLGTSVVVVSTAALGALTYRAVDSTIVCGELEGGALQEAARYIVVAAVALYGVMHGVAVCCPRRALHLGILLADVGFAGGLLAGDALIRAGNCPACAYTLQHAQYVVAGLAVWMLTTLPTSAKTSSARAAKTTSSVRFPSYLEGQL